QLQAWRRGPQVRRTSCTLNVRPRALTKQMGPSRRSGWDFVRASTSVARVSTLEVEPISLSGSALGFGGRTSSHSQQEGSAFGRRPSRRNLGGDDRKGGEALSE